MVDGEISADFSSSRRVMSVKTVEEYLAFFEEHPTLMVLVVLASIVAWVVRADVFGFVSRRKRQRQDDAYETYRRLDAMGGLSDDERASLIAEVRKTGEGLSAAVLVEQDGEGEPDCAPEIHLPWVAEQAVRVADGVLFVFFGFLFVGMFAMSVVWFIGGLAMMVDFGGDLGKLATGLVCMVLGALMVWVFGGGVLRSLIEKFPRRLAFLSEGLGRLALRTELARAFGQLAFLVVLHIVLVAGFFFIAYLIVAESDSTWAWAAAVPLGMFAVAIAVKSTTKALEFLGVFDADEVVEVEAVGS